MFSHKVFSGLKSPRVSMARVSLPRKTFAHPFNKVLASRIRKPSMHGFRMGMARTVTKGIQDYLKNPTVSRVVKAVPVEPPKKELNLEPLKTGDARDLPEFKQTVKEMSQKYNVDQKFIMEVIRQESAFKPNAKSHAGAMGLMQLMPGTAKDLGVENPYDIRENIEGGVKYLRKMLDMFGQDKRMALAGYNAGPGAVKRYGGIPPYKETTHYVAKIMKNYLKGS